MYAYIGNDPVNFTDPRGLFPDSKFDGLANIFGSAPGDPAGTSSFGTSLSDFYAAQGVVPVSSPISLENSAFGFSATTGLRFVPIAGGAVTPTVPDLALLKSVVNFVLFDFENPSLFEVATFIPAFKIAKGARFVDPGLIRFTQDTVRPFFGNRNQIGDVADALRRGAPDLPPIKVFQRNGATFTLDNRRLVAYSLAGRRIPTIPAMTRLWRSVRRRPAQHRLPRRGSFVQPAPRRVLRRGLEQGGLTRLGAFGE